MRQLFPLLILFTICSSVFAQKTTAAKEPLVPCTGDADADAAPGRYTDHTNTKYPSSLKGTPQEKPVMLKQLISIEKVEEASRRNFQLNGCFARVSFSGGNKKALGDHVYNGYGYQLGVYAYVCHVTEHVVKTVGEYRTVMRVDVNPSFAQGSFYGEGGDFYITDKSVRYDIPTDAKMGPGYDKNRVYNRSRITRYISEEMVLTGRSDDYENKHADFLKLINGNGYVENWLAGSRKDKPDPKSYKWIDRHYLITKPGIPLLIPVTRKEYLEALLEYYEIEKANFLQMVAYKVSDDTRSSSAEAKKRMNIYQADKAAYQQIYETKKAKVQQLLSSQKAEWLQEQAVAKNQLRENDYAQASNGLLDFTSFYDGNEKAERLYQYNPQYFKTSAGQPLKPVLMEVQFRYELERDRGFSKRLFDNFLENYDMDALRKMLN